MRISDDISGDQATSRGNVSPCTRAGCNHTEASAPNQPKHNPGKSFVPYGFQSPKAPASSSFPTNVSLAHDRGRPGNIVWEGPEI